LVMKMVMPNMDDGDGDVAFSSSLKSWNPCTREWKIVSILN
jgi:hypothetical protein